MVGKWGKVSLRGRAQVISREPPLSLHHSQFALFGLFHRGETLGLLWLRLGTVSIGKTVILNNYLRYLVLPSLICWVFNSTEKFTDFPSQLDHTSSVTCKLFTWSLMYRFKILKYSAFIKFLTDLSAIKESPLSQRDLLKGSKWFQHQAVAVWS